MQEKDGIDKTRTGRRMLSQNAVLPAQLAAPVVPVVVPPIALGAQAGLAPVPAAIPGGGPVAAAALPTPSGVVLPTGAVALVRANDNLRIMPACMLPPPGACRASALHQASSLREHAHDRVWVLKQVVSIACMHAQVPAMANVGLNPGVAPAALPSINSISSGGLDLATAAAVQQAQIAASQGRGGGAVRSTHLFCVDFLF